MDNLNHVQQLRDIIKDLEEQLKVSNKKLNRLESGSNKSLLNCHAEGKKNFQGYIDLHYPNLKTPGNFIRRLFDQVEPYSYEDIISGDY